MPKKVKDNEPNRADECVQNAVRAVARGNQKEAVALYKQAAGLYRSEGLTEEAEEAEWMAKEYGKKRATDELLPVPVKDFRGSGHNCDNCGAYLEQKDYAGVGSWSYKCPDCKFKYQHSGAPVDEQLVAFKKRKGSKDSLQPVPVGDAFSLVPKAWQDPKDSGGYPKCPKCGSKKVAVLGGSGPSASTSTYKCLECGNSTSRHSAKDATGDLAEQVAEMEKELARLESKPISYAPRLRALKKEIATGKAKLAKRAAKGGDVSRVSDEELKPVPVNDTSSIEKYNAARQAESETKLKSPAGEEERQARNAETLKKMREGKAKDEQLPSEVARLAKQLGSLYAQLDNGEDVTDDKFDAVEHKLEQLGYECGTYGPSTGKVWKKEGKAKDAEPVWMCSECKTGFSNKGTLEGHQEKTGHWRTPTGNPIKPEGDQWKGWKAAGKDGADTRYKIYTGPTVVHAAAEKLKAAGIMDVTEGTEHVYISTGKSVDAILSALGHSGWSPKDVTKIGDSSPTDLLSTAQDQEIAQDRKRALDSYRKAASAFRSTGDSKQEAVAREGIDECQRKLVGGVDSTYSHPSSGKVQAFDAADRALTSAIQRTRAGERVRMARDSKTGETVVEPVKDKRKATDESISEECGRKCSEARKQHDEPRARGWKEYFQKVLFTKPEAERAAMRKEFDEAYKAASGYGGR